MSEQPPAGAGALLPTLYRTEQVYGWSRGMRAVSRALLKRVTLPPGPIVELGCGAGSLATQLSAGYPDRDVYGLELSALALGYARAGPAWPLDLTRANLHTLPFADGSIGTIIALDVFDQYGVDLGWALTESRRVLQVGGILLVRVSAHPRLAGAHDRAFNTAQRHTRRSITSALSTAGFQLYYVTYANALPSIPVATIRLLQKHGLLGLHKTDYTHAWADRLLSTVLKWEAAWLNQRNLPFGLSLYVLAHTEKAASPTKQKEHHHRLGVRRRC